MNNLFERIRESGLINSVISLIIGIMLVANPFGSSATIAWIIGLFVLISGISGIIKFISVKEFKDMYRGTLVSAIIKCVIGLFIVTHAGTMISLIVRIMGLFLVCNAAGMLDGVKMMEKTGIYDKTLKSRGIVLLILGLVMLIMPVKATSLAVMIVGGIIILNAAIEIYTYIKAKKNIM